MQISPFMIKKLYSLDGVFKARFKTRLHSNPVSAQRECFKKRTG